MRAFQLAFTFTLSLFFCCSQTPEKFTLLDSAIKILKKEYPKEWTISKFGSRVILTRKDSILVANAYTGYKPGKIPGNSILKFKYQLYVDFYEPDLDFTNGMHKLINDSLDRLIRSFRKKHYGKGEYYVHLEAMETLEKMKLKEPLRLKSYDLRFSDNCASDWIPYNISDIKHVPFEPPTSFQKEIMTMKEKIFALLKEAGI